MKSGEQGDVNLYCGCAVLLFAGMYFFNKEIRIVEKIVLGLLIVLYFAGFHVTMLNLLFHGLHKPVGIPNRFAFVLVFLLLRVTSDAWEKISVQSRKWLFAGLAAAEIFCVAVGDSGWEKQRNFILSRCYCTDVFTCVDGMFYLWKTSGKPLRTCGNSKNMQLYTYAVDPCRNRESTGL